VNARLWELAREFTRLGLTAFGGPAAHIAIMQREFVDQKAWLTRERFVDLLGLSSLLPGPSSTEVALGIGYERARWPGLLMAALGFIVPASLGSWRRRSSPETARVYGVGMERFGDRRTTVIGGIGGGALVTGDVGCVSDGGSLAGGASR
jgi:hypothetical protein